ncbi:MAG: hypothetical protein EHM78_11770 [Myxococcaceae bacterium]|nr:MAG: hypothetical protein EHM78_11770 [Myxococcaceae bacterium]
MLTWRNSGRLAALAAALTLAACGSSSGGGAEDPCDLDVLQKGCVGFRNFTTNPQEIAGVTVPPKTTANNLTSPGKRAVMVTNTSVSATHSFQAQVNGQSQSVTCTVTPVAWVSVNPSVVVQQSGDVDCDGTW